MTNTYSIYRGWRDGESMTQHLMHSGIASVEEALEKSRMGGYVVRESDGASLAPDGSCWINDSGEPIEAGLCA